jgi:Helix-turn-helix domain
VTGRLAVKAEQAAELLSVSRDTFDRHIAAELRCVRRGRLKLYAVAELTRWLQENQARAI